jgi:hypothetical protein
MAGRSEWLSLNGLPSITGRRGQRSTVGIITDILKFGISRPLLSRLTNESGCHYFDRLELRK